MRMCYLQRLKLRSSRTWSWISHQITRFVRVCVCVWEGAWAGLWAEREAGKSGLRSTYLMRCKRERERQSSLLQSSQGRWGNQWGEFIIATRRHVTGRYTTHKNVLMRRRALEDRKARWGDATSSSFLSSSLWLPFVVSWRYFHVSDTTFPWQKHETTTGIHAKSRWGLGNERRMKMVVAPAMFLAVVTRCFTNPEFGICFHIWGRFQIVVVIVSVSKFCVFLPGCLLYPITYSQIFA